MLLRAATVLLATGCFAVDRSRGATAYTHAPRQAARTACLPSSRQLVQPVKLTRGKQLTRASRRAHCVTSRRTGALASTVLSRRETCHVAPRTSRPCRPTQHGSHACALPQGAGRAARAQQVQPACRAAGARQEGADDGEGADDEAEELVVAVPPGVVGPGRGRGARACASVRLGSPGGFVTARPRRARWRERAPGAPGRERATVWRAAMVWGRARGGVDDLVARLRSNAGGETMLVLGTRTFGTWRAARGAEAGVGGRRAGGQKTRRHPEQVPVPKRKMTNSTCY